MKKLTLRTLPVLPDESLSSWLLRCALFHGCDPLTLGWWIWGHDRVWTVDFERNLSVVRLTELERATALQRSDLQSLLLQDKVSMYNRHFNPDQAFWPWLLHQGKRNRSKAYGQPFCPQCFAESTPYLRREWRLAWVTSCTKHQIMLQDTCPECGFLYVPAKLKGLENTIAVCHHCGHDLRKNPSVPADTAFQQEACGKDAEWFEIVRAAIKIIRMADVHPAGGLAAMIHELGVNPRHIPQTSTGGTFEWLTITERHQFLMNALVLVRQPMEVWLVAARKNSVTLNAIRNAVGRNFPAAWQELEAGLTILEKKRTQNVKRSVVTRLSEEAVMKKWARLERKIQRVSGS